MKVSSMKRIMAIVLTVVLWLGGTSLATAGDEPDTVSYKQQLDETSIKVLSWNIHCLPPFAYVNGKRKRARQIGKLLNEEDYDVVIFQEAFHHGARRELEKHMKKYPYHVGPANARYITIRTNSGIYMMSKLPIKKVDKVKFKEKATSDDKMARKGALMVEGEKNGHRFQIVGTHLNAGGPIKVRHSQVQQIRDELLIPYQKEGVPQIIGGDMNMRKQSDNYPFMLKTYDAEDGHLEVSEAMRNGCPEKNNRSFRDDVIDFIFYRSNNKEPRQVIRRVPCFSNQWNKDGDDWLSDHPPMEIELKY